MTTVTEIEKIDGELLVKGKLKLVEIDGFVYNPLLSRVDENGSWLEKNGKLVYPIVIGLHHIRIPVVSNGFVINRKFGRA